MRTFRTVEEIRGAVGEHLGYSGWVCVTQEQINAFADLTNDHQWIHVDPARAASGPYGAPIAHGYLTLSLVPTMASEVYAIEGVAMAINYGTDKVRFPGVVPAGSSLRAGVEVRSVDAVSSGVQVLTRVVVERKGSDKPVCVVESVTLLVP